MEDTDVRQKSEERLICSLITNIRIKKHSTKYCEKDKNVTSDEIQEGFLEEVVLAIGSEAGWDFNPTGIRLGSGPLRDHLSGVL